MRRCKCVVSFGRPRRRHKYSLRQHYAVRRSPMMNFRRGFHRDPPAVCHPTKQPHNENQKEERLWTTDDDVVHLLLRHVYMNKKWSFNGVCYLFGEKHYRKGRCFIVQNLDYLALYSVYKLMGWPVFQYINCF